MNQIITIENGLAFELINQSHTAYIIFSPTAKGDILITKTVQCQGRDFTITKIKKGSFNNNKFITKLEFADDSSLVSIEKNSFKNSSIKSIFIPSNCNELQEGWCNKAYELENVTISPNNRYFKYADESHKMIIGKSDKNSDDFDTIVFGCKNIESIIIPSTIKKICSYSFGRCSQLKTVEIPENSELLSIGKKVFSLSLINSIFIPSKVEYIEEGFFDYIPYLKTICISPQNQYIKFADEQHQIIVVKSDKNANNYDVLLYANRKINEAKIPPNITRIGKFAFGKCFNLKTIDIPENSKLQSIGKDAFFDSSIEKIFIPKDVKELEDKWYRAASNLNEVIISPNNQNYKYLNDKKEIITARSNDKLNVYDIIIFACRSITSVTIPSYIKVINSYSFENCSQLKTVEFMQNSELKVIGAFAFSFSQIERLIIPKNVEIIGESAFYFCQELQRVKIQKGSKLKTISKKLFHYCQKLKSIKIPKICELKTIKNDAFFNCPIKHIYFPPSIEELEEDWSNAFRLDSVIISSSNQFFNYADNEKKIVVGKSDKNAKNYDVLIFASKYITKAQIPDNIKKINSNAFNYCRDLESIEISENSELQSVGKNAFYFCDKLENFFIPSHLKELQKGWCYKTRNLTSIKISPNNKYFKFADSKKTIIVGKSDNNKDIFDEIVFAKRDIKAVKIPPTIKIIKSYSFENCSKLKSVEIPENTELQTIEDSAFSCTMIDMIKIPKNVEKIDADAFSYCENLTKFEIEEDSKLTQISNFLFSFCMNLKTIKIPNNSQIKKIEQSAFDKSIIESLFIPSSIIELEDGWCDCTYKLTNVEISPKNDRFRFLNEKHQIIVSKSDLSNDNYDVICFACRSIQEVIIPSFIKEISSSAFSDCKKLTKIEISEKSELLSIGMNAFRSTSIENILIPRNINEIWYGVFADCKVLKIIEFLGDYLYDSSDLFCSLEKINIISFPNIRKIRIKDEDVCHINDSKIFICSGANLM